MPQIAVFEARRYLEKRHHSEVSFPGTLNNHFLMVVSIGLFQIMTNEKRVFYQTSIKKWSALDGLVEGSLEV